MLFYTGSQVAVPWIIKIGLDSYIKVGDFAGLTWIVALFIGNAVLYWGSYYAEEITLAAFCVLNNICSAENHANSATPETEIQISDDGNLVQETPWYRKPSTSVKPPTMPIIAAAASALPITNCPSRAGAKTRRRNVPCERSLQ